MTSTSRAAKKNLLLCFDAFGTLFTPSVSIPVAYARTASKYGIDCGDPENPREVGARFKEAFKDESKRNPNYGKATGLGAEKWWGNVIQKTFTAFLKPNQEIPSTLVTDLLHRYSSSEGYNLYPDVLPFFEKLRHSQVQGRTSPSDWPFNRTVVGIITNSDSRVTSILQSFGLKIGPRRIGTSDQRKEQARMEDDISFVVLSYDVGFEKPNRTIFDGAVDMLSETLTGNEDGLAMNDFEKLYIGDDLEKDYDGAIKAGWDAVLLNRHVFDDSVVNRGLRWEIHRDSDGIEKRVRLASSMKDLSHWQPS